MVVAGETGFVVDGRLGHPDSLSLKDFLSQHAGNHLSPDTKTPVIAGVN
jgi:hypothetical protein